MEIRETCLKNSTVLKELGLSVSIRPMHVSFLRFLEHVGTLTKLFKPFKLQELFIELSSKETLGFPISCPYIWICSSIKELKESRWLNWSFYVSYMTRLRTISFFHTVFN